MSRAGKTTKGGGSSLRARNCCVGWEEKKKNETALESIISHMGTQREKLTKRGGSQKVCQKERTKKPTKKNKGRKKKKGRKKIGLWKEGGHNVCGR